MNPGSEDVKDMLEAESSLGLTHLTNLFISREPTTPSNCVTLYDTQGRPPQLTLNRDEKYYYEGLQIRVRNKDYSTGWALIRAIQNSLHGRALETWNETVYTLIFVTSGPALIGYDESNRVILTINFELQRR